MRPAARSLVAALALLWAAWQPLSAADAQDIPPPVTRTLSLSANVGIGYMRGGHSGGLMTAQRAPLALDIQALTVKAPRMLLGGALRIELEQAKSVAAIVRVQLRHPFGPLELRPGVGLPFYFAPRTMLGPEASLTMKLGISSDLGILVDLMAAAFMIGNDVPHGSTVVMLHAFLGLELFI
ncbi:MAG: hypothetical protein ABW321_21550 [Polyangiales bacterium]